MEGRVERLLYEVAHYAGKPASYVVITWNIDETSMCWQDFCKRSEALALYQNWARTGEGILCRQMYGNRHDAASRLTD